MNRRWLITLLAGINLFLLGLVILTVSSAPAAYAQVVPPRGTDYMLVAAESDNKNEVLYLIDSKSKRLYAFRTIFGNTMSAPTRFALMAQRDLAVDFRRAQ